MSFTFHIKTGTHQLLEFVLRASVGSRDFMNLVLSGELTVDGVLTPDGKLTRKAMIAIAKNFIIANHLYNQPMYVDHLRMFWKMYTIEPYTATHAKEIYTFFIPILRACSQKFNRFKSLQAERQSVS